MFSLKLPVVDLPEEVAVILDPRLYKISLFIPSVWIENKIKSQRKEIKLNPSIKRK